MLNLQQQGQHAITHLRYMLHFVNAYVLWSWRGSIVPYLWKLLSVHKPLASAFTLFEALLTAKEKTVKSMPELTYMFSTVRSLGFPNDEMLTLRLLAIFLTELLFSHCNLEFCNLVVPVPQHLHHSLTYSVKPRDLHLQLFACHRCSGSLRHLYQRSQPTLLLLAWSYTNPKNPRSISPNFHSIRTKMKPKSKTEAFWTSSKTVTENRRRKNSGNEREL